MCLRTLTLAQQIKRMDSQKKLGVLLAKIVLSCGRVCGLTFGGVSFQNSRVNLFKRSNLQISKKLKFFGFFLLPVVLTFCVYSLARLTKNVITYPKGTIIDCLYVARITFYMSHYFAFYVVNNCFGEKILEFLLKQRLTRNQFRLALLILVLPTATVLLRHGLYLSEAAAKYNMTLKRMIVSEAILLANDLPWAFGTSLRLLLSLAAYWAVKRITSKFSIISSNSNSNVLNEISKEFLNLKNSFNKLDSLFHFLNLSDFATTISFILMDIAMILNDNVVGGTSQLCFNLMSLIVLCWIHGLPHKACRNMVNTFDNSVVILPPNTSIQQTNIVLTRDTIGFKLLGHNYEPKILASVCIQSLRPNSFFEKRLILFCFFCRHSYLFYLMLSC